MSGHDWHDDIRTFVSGGGPDGPYYRQRTGEAVSGKSYEMTGAETRGPDWGGELRGSAADPRKDSNPKDVAGSARIDLSLISPFAMAEEALAFEEGGTKYGYYNYTVVGVKARVYVSAALRHIFKWLMGEERDPKTGVHHLGSVRACMGILIDAQVRGKLFDDRPPSHKEASSWLDRMEARVKTVREVFKTFAPRHYTIKDTHHGEGTGEQIHRERPQATSENRARREDAQPVQGRDC